MSTCDTEEGHVGAMGDLRRVLLGPHQARNPLRHHGASSSPLRESHHCRSPLVVALYAVHLFTAVYWHTSGSARTLLSTDVGFRGLAPMPSGGNQLRTKVRATLPPSVGQGRAPPPQPPCWVYNISIKRTKWAIFVAKIRVSFKDTIFVHKLWCTLLTS